MTRVFNPQLMDEVVNALKTVYDPEMTVNIYDLGLIYDIMLEEDEKVSITMTLTNPNCPAAEIIPEDVKKALLKLKNVTEVTVSITFEPPWDSSKMSDDVMLDLGLL